MTSLSQLLPGGDDGARTVFVRGGGIVTLARFRRDAARLVARLQDSGKKRAVLQADDLYAFSVGLLGCLHAGLHVTLPPNAAAGTLQACGGEDSLLVGDAAVAGALPILLPDGAECREAELLPFDARETEIVFSTSGSSGEPKKLPKSLAHLEAEVAAVRVFHSDNSPHVFSTVSPMHAYGVIFCCLMPLARGWVIECLPTCGVEGVLQAVDACGHPTWLVSSPAFLSMWESNAALFPLRNPPETVLSAGAPLPESVARALPERFGLVIHEVFGSTETGVTANRNRAGDLWTPFPGVRVEPCEAGVRVTSPCVGGDGSHILGDAIEPMPGGRFKLLGRVDRIVKLADKRLSLPEVETRLRACPEVKDAAAEVLCGDGRARLGVVVVLTQAGLDLLAAEGYGGCSARLRRALSADFDPVLLPRRWRFVGALPLTPQSKIDHAAMRDLFAEKPLMPWYDVVSQSASSLEIKLLFVKDTPCYAGHFPRFPLVPGVLFIHVANRMLERFAHLRITGVARYKFCCEVHPGEHCSMRLEWGASAVRVNVELQDGTLCSTGRFFAGASNN